MDKETLRSIITNQLDDAQVKFLGDDCNLKVSVKSNHFKGMTMIQQHRLVLNLLKSNFKSGELHALSLETKSK